MYEDVDLKGLDMRLPEPEIERISFIRHVAETVLSTMAILAALFLIGWLIVIFLVYVFTWIVILFA